MLNFNEVNRRITEVTHPYFDVNMNGLEFNLLEKLKQVSKFDISFQPQSHYALLHELDWLNRQVAYAQFVHWATVVNKKVNNEADLALLDSIQKWFEVSFLYKQDKNVEDCALCKMFLHQNETFRCDACPVKLKTGHRGCIGTPYALFRQITKNSYGLVTNHNQLKLALAMLQFLMNLYHERQFCEQHAVQKNFDQWQQELQEKVIKSFEAPNFTHGA